MRENGFIASLREEILSRADPAARAAIERDLNRLAELGIASFQDALALARDPSSPAEVRALAVWCLGQAGEEPPHSRLALAGMLETENDERVVWELAKAVATAPDPNERPELAARLSGLLEASRDLEKRRAIAFALGLLGEARAVEPLLRVLAEAAGAFELCEDTVEALGNLASPTAAEGLATASERIFNLQSEIVRALVEIGGSGASRNLEILAGFAKSLDQEIVLALSRIDEINQHK